MKPTRQPHYIPECYSKYFCSDSSNPRTGFLYKKSKHLEPPVPVQPVKWGKKRDYYAFENKDGLKDTQTLEKMYGICEAGWPELVSIFEQGLQPYPEHINNLCTFLATMRIRVPNYRLQIEERRAIHAKNQGIAISRYHPEINQDIEQKIRAALDGGNIESATALKKLKQDFDSGNFDVAVDPETSILGIQHIEVIHKHLLALNWVILHSSAENDFVTTDNPVVWYDLRKEASFIPYFAGLGWPSVEVIFPLTKKLLLVGNHAFDKPFAYASFKSGKEGKVDDYNKKLVIAAEEYVFASQNNHGPLITAHHNVVPRVTYYNKSNGRAGFQTFFRASLGPPHKLPKWKDSTNKQSSKKKSANE